jgi:hypothetical protein
MSVCYAGWNETPVVSPDDVETDKYTKKKIY